MITINLQYKRVRQCGRKKWIVYNTHKKGSHTHFYTEDACKDIICLLEKGILPSNEYFLESAKRLLAESEFKKLGKKKKKPRYYNRGGRKVG